MLIALPVAVLYGQESEFTLNVNVDLVELNVSVLDQNERNVTGLSAEHFEVLEDQIPQQFLCSCMRTGPSAWDS